MSEKNGTYKTVIAVIVFIIAVLGAGISIYSNFHVPLANAIEAEASQRGLEDKEIRKDIKDLNSEIVALRLESRDKQAETNIMLTRIAAKMGVENDRYNPRPSN